MVTLWSAAPVVTVTAAGVVVAVVGVVSAGFHGVLGAGVVGELEEPLLESHVQRSDRSLLVPVYNIEDIMMGTIIIVYQKSF